MLLSNATDESEAHLSWYQTTREGQHTRPIEIIGGDRRARGARRGQCRAPGRPRAHGAHGTSHGNRRGAPHTILGTRSAPASTAGTTLCGSRSSARTARVTAAQPTVHRRWSLRSVASAKLLASDGLAGRVVGVAVVEVTSTTTRLLASLPARRQPTKTVALLRRPEVRARPNLA